MREEGGVLDLGFTVAGLVQWLAAVPCVSLSAWLLGPCSVFLSVSQRLPLYPGVWGAVCPWDLVVAVGEGPLCRELYS